MPELNDTQIEPQKIVRRSRFPKRLFARVLLVQTTLILTSLLATGLTVRYFFKKHYLAQVEVQLRNTLKLLSTDLSKSKDSDWCATHALSNDYRFTLIKTDGTVACDSHHEPLSMENHSLRPEVVDALRGGSGQSLRFSQTLQEQMLYVAIKASPSGTILRGAIPLQALQHTLRLIDFSIIIFLMLISLFLGVIAYWQGRQFVAPMTRILEETEGLLDSDEGQASPNEFTQDSYGEWSELESSIADLKSSLREKIEALSQQKAEQAILMSSISDAIVAIGPEGNPLFYNSRFGLLFFNQGQSEHPRLWEIIRDPSILEAFKEALTEGRSSNIKSAPFLHISERLYFSVSISPLRRAGDEIYGAIGIFHDVTDLKRAEQIRIDFVANVSHELRTPLTVIKGYADTMVIDLEQKRPIEKEYVQAIHRNSERLMSLINDLLDLSSLEATDNLQKTQISPKDFTEKLLTQMGSALEQKKQKVTLRADPVTLIADPTRLEQVLVNLVDNARKYSPIEGRIHIDWASAPNSNVLLIVSDTGPGIAKEHQERLFERFYRVDKSRSRDMGGTGLGLAIVKHIMQRHGGSVRVESELGKGSKFICEFPSAINLS